MIVVAGVLGGSATGAGRPGVAIGTGGRRGSRCNGGGRHARIKAMTKNDLKKEKARSWNATHKNKSKHLKHLLYHGNPKYQFQGKSND
jgi:hypothetical protein